MSANFLLSLLANTIFRFLAESTHSYIEWKNQPMQKKLTKAMPSSAWRFMSYYTLLFKRVRLDIKKINKNKNNEM